MYAITLSGESFLYYQATAVYYIIRQNITLSGSKFITLSGDVITLLDSYYIIRRFYYIIRQLLHYQAIITLSVVTTHIRKNKSVE